MDDIKVIAVDIINNFIRDLNINNDNYYYNKIIAEKQELMNNYDSNTVDDICDCIVDLLEKYLKENNLNGIVENGYNEIMIVQ